MYYIKKKIEKKELINKNKNLYFKIFNKKLIFYYNNMSLLLYYRSSNILHIKQYLKEVGII